MTQHGRHNAKGGTPPDTAGDDASEDAASEDVALDSDEDSIPDEVVDAPLGDHRSFFDNDIPVGDEPLR